MKNFVFAALALVASTAFAADKGNKDDAVKAAVANLDTTIAKHDAKGVADLFADDGTFVSPMGDGKVIKGKAEIQKAHEGMFATVGKTLVTKHTVQNVRWIGKDHALVDCSVEMNGMKMDGPPGAPAPAFHAVLMLEEKAGKWMFADARPYSVMPPPPAPPAAPAK